MGVRQDDWKALKIDRNVWKLYNVVEDMGEHNDLSGAHGEQLRKMVAAAEVGGQNHTEPKWFASEEPSVDRKAENKASFVNTLRVDR